MFRTMRRRKQALPLARAFALLQRNTTGVLALSGDNGYPYAVPLNYVFVKPDNGNEGNLGRLIFHSAVEGHKIDALNACDKGSFCVIDADEIDQKHFTTHFRSAIAFGRLHLLQGDQAVWACRALGLGFNPDPAAVDAEMAHAFNRTAMIEMTIEHLSAKQAIELMDRPVLGQ